VPFGHILGQATAVATLSRALESAKVHHAYRFEGPEGVGKERTAMAFAQALLCTAGEPLGCGRCDACSRAGELSRSEPPLPRHPDLVLIERGLYPPESLGSRRPELTEISVQQIRQLVLTRAAYPPHEGRAQVFVVRRADELSTSAANALLKTLEEPRPDTHFVLLSSQPSRLLATIRSRSLAVRFGPLSDEVLAQILSSHGVAAERIGPAVEMAGGSVSAALEAADPELFEARQTFVRAVLEAARAPHLGAAVELGESADGDRRRLRVKLEGLAAHFARDARAAVRDSEAQAERLPAAIGGFWRPWRAWSGMPRPA